MNSHSKKGSNLGSPSCSLIKSANLFASKSLLFDSILNLFPAVIIDHIMLESDTFLSIISTNALLKPELRS